MDSPLTHDSWLTPADFNDAIAFEQQKQQYTKTILTLLLPDCLVSMVHSYQPLLLSPLDVDRVWWRHSKFPRSRPVSTSVSQSKKMRFFICLYRWVVVHPSDFCLYDLNLFSLFPPVCFDTRFSVYGFGLNFTGIFFLDSGKRIYIIPGSQQIFVSTPLTNYCVRRSQNNFVLWENKKVLYTKKCFKSILRVCFDL